MTDRPTHPRARRPPLWKPLVLALVATVACARRRVDTGLVGEWETAGSQHGERFAATAMIERDGEMVVTRNGVRYDAELRTDPAAGTFKMEQRGYYVTGDYSVLFGGQAFSMSLAHVGDDTVPDVIWRRPGWTLPSAAAVSTADAGRPFLDPAVLFPDESAAGGREPEAVPPVVAPAGWQGDLYAALDRAHRSGLPLLVYLRAEEATPATRRLEDEVFADPDMDELADDAVLLWLESGTPGLVALSFVAEPPALLLAQVVAGTDSQGERTVELAPGSKVVDVATFLANYEKSDDVILALWLELATLAPPGTGQGGG